MASFAEIEKENNPKTTIIKYAEELHENWKKCYYLLFRMAK